MVDAADAGPSTGIMLAFLPAESEWCQLELPHMTLVYAGTTDQRTASEFSALAKDASLVATLINRFGLRVKGISQFGEDPDKVDVLTFKMTPQLEAARSMVEKWNKSDYTFAPHATIGPAKYMSAPYQPDFVYFDRLYLGWGEQGITFWLK